MLVLVLVLVGLLVLVLVGLLVLVLVGLLVLVGVFVLVLTGLLLLLLLTVILSRDCQEFCAVGHDDEKERIITWLSRKNFWTSSWLDVIHPRFSARTVCWTI
ncbi:hypothetical protein [Sinorhizobium medicae]|uniref:hypothetical protein n=1 Tax=Sinorhizobium medicae TaxID=110321 RepID=UPI0019173EF6|nr:hypothetical protein [Sinorhizobium medicae]